MFLRNDIIYQCIIVVFVHSLMNASMVATKRHEEIFNAFKEQIEKNKDKTTIITTLLGNLSSEEKDSLKKLLQNKIDFHTQCKDWKYDTQSLQQAGLYVLAALAVGYFGYTVYTKWHKPANEKYDQLCTLLQGYKNSKDQSVEIKVTEDKKGKDTFLFHKIDITIPHGLTENQHNHAQESKKILQGLYDTSDLLLFVECMFGVVSFCLGASGYFSAQSGIYPQHQQKLQKWQAALSQVNK